MVSRGIVWSLLVSSCAAYSCAPGPEQITRARLRELAGRSFGRFLGDLDTKLTLFRAVPKGGEEALLKPFGATADHVRLVRPFFAEGLKARRCQALANIAPPCRTSRGATDGCGSCEHCRRCEETRCHIRAIFERLAVRQGSEVALRKAIRQAAHEENVATLGLGNYPLSELKASLDERDQSGQLYMDLVARGIYTEHFLISFLHGKR